MMSMIADLHDHFGVSKHEPVYTAVQVEPHRKERELISFLRADAVQKQIKKVLPLGISIETITRAAITSIKKDSKLAECTPESFCQSLANCAQVGMVPGGAFSLVNLIPFFNSKTMTYQCQMVIGWQGWLEIIYRHPRVVRVDAQVVREGDLFDYEFGIHSYVQHKPMGPANRPITHFYSDCVLTNEGYVSELIFEEDMQVIKSRSKNNIFWKNHYDAMGKKTAIIRLAKRLPKTPELELATSVEIENEIEYEKENQDGI